MLEKSSIFICEKLRKKIDYSEFLFVDVIWERDNINDLETIIFNDEGSFSYSCVCVNLVNDADLCESYELKFK